jgi:dihydroorotate dehydrogenase electron transfer subunit
LCLVSVLSRREGNVAVFEHKAEVVRNEEVAPNTYLMGLESFPIASTAKPGQFVMLRVADGIDPLLRRPFSICSVNDGTTLLLLYRVVGTGTRIMADTRAGSHLSIMGPLGRGFEPPGAGEKCLLAAGGMGIAPLVFLARSLEKTGVTLMTGYGTAAEIVSPAQLGMQDLAIAVATEDASAGYHGLVTALLEHGLAGKGKKIVYSCGPAAMLKKVASLCLERGVECQVSLETVMACGVGACQGCAVPAAPESGRSSFHVCQDGPVFSAASIDWENL